MSRQKTLAKAVSRCLTTSSPDWWCRACIADAITLSVRDVKIGLLVLAHLPGRGALATCCAVCAACGQETAVVRIAQPPMLRRVA